MINKIGKFLGMRTSTKSEVIVYYDETRGLRGINSKGHAFLFIPYKSTIKQETPLFGMREKCIFPRQLLYDKVVEVRSKYDAFYRFHFKEISGKKWTKYNVAEKEIIEVSIDALRYKNPKIFELPLGCKLAIIFYHKPRDLSLYGGSRKEKVLRYDETLMRILLKGAVHFVYDKDSTVEILKIISDGDPHHRKLSNDRILQRLIEDNLLGRGSLREYVTISQNAEIIQQTSQHKKYKERSEEFINANMLQLSDMLLGGVICSCYRGANFCNVSPPIDHRVEDKKTIIAYSIKEMLDKRKRGRNFIYSSHYKSFSLSRAFIDSGMWKFENITTKEVTINPDTLQISLFELSGL